MISWFKNKEIEVFFSEIPQVGIRYYIPTMSMNDRKSIEKYPFINKKKLEVKLIDNKKNKQYEFTIPKGYCYDGASIPKFFWRLIGSNTDNKFLIPALVHDVLCENHEYIDNDRKFSSLVFNGLLEANCVNFSKRFFMKYSVEIYQKYFCNWEIGKDVMAKYG